MTEWTSGKQKLRRSAEDDLGGTMRLGAYECHLTEGSIASRLYGKRLFLSVTVIVTRSILLIVISLLMLEC